MTRLLCVWLGHNFLNWIYRPGIYVEEWRPPAAPVGVRPVITYESFCERGCVGSRHITIDARTSESIIPSPGVPSL